jgi:ADP-ribosyl-[dinitrogen reductase] hydrolase
MADKPIIPLDKIQGMFMGVFLSDALGAPHEFSRTVPYTGILEHRAYMNTQYQGKKELEVGQITDDSEMSIALLRTILTDKGYNRDNVIKSYLDWANSGGWMIGKNTRKLLKGVTTIKGYNSRMLKEMETPESLRSQSNGTLMRCTPLALIWNNDVIIQDVDITNPNDVNRDCGLIYVNALRLALIGSDGMTIFNTVKELAQTDSVKEIMGQVERREVRKINDKATKGWCVNALWCAMVVITTFTNFSEAMNWVITSQPGSDTDTNGAIAGGLLGCILGLNKMKDETNTNKNIDILLAVDVTIGPTPRPLIYRPCDFYTLMEAAHALTL